jgi:hypothetical protein
MQTQTHNPFDLINVRLSTIEGLLLDLKHGTLIPEPDPSTTWGTMATAAAWANATLPQLRMWRFNNADFPASKIGKSIRINKAEFLAWLEKKRPASAVEAVDGQLNDLKAKKARTGVQNA